MNRRNPYTATGETASATGGPVDIARFGGSLRVVRSRSIHDVPEHLWDSVNAQVDLYHTHRFIRSVEDAGGDQARFWYLLFFQDEKLAGTAALSSFVVRLDLFLGTGSQRLIGALRRIAPSLLLLRVLFCGLPISIGKNTIAVAPGIDRRRILRHLVQEMISIARTEKLRVLCVKEFLEAETPEMEELCRQGFLRAASLPYARLRLKWRSFDEYLSELRHGYRRHILRSMKKLSAAVPPERELPSGAASAGSASLAVGGPELCPAPTFHRLYLEVMRRAEVTLETLSLEFFERLYENLSGELMVFAVVLNGKVLGAALCALEGKRMTFLLVGLDYAARDAYDVYFNLVYGITRNAIERGCSTLDLGQTSYWVKSRIGAEIVPQCFYLRSENSIAHQALRLLRSLLFPGISPPRPRVLKLSHRESAAPAPT